MSAAGASRGKASAFAPAPGDLIAEILRSRGMSASELARRCGRSPKLIIDILAGRAPVEPETALQIGRVLGTDPTLWMELEARYRLRLATASETSRMPSASEWASRFPLRELKTRGLIPRTEGPAGAVPHLLRLFGAGTIEACEERFNELASVSYRHSPSFKSSEGALLVWLRLGERRAEEAEAAEYDRKTFLSVLGRVRGLTALEVNRFLPTLTSLLASAGVVFVLEKPFQGVALSGVARWISPRRALIQQTLRHRSNDHFWFTFFHEAAHLLFHSRKATFIDGSEELVKERPDDETEANVWAAGYLVPASAMKAFVTAGNFSRSDVVEFAAREGVAPGIVVGQLQKRGCLPYSALNELKLRLDFP
jgi:HTH-type transcriptional regulator / antitoxin HigA